MSLKEYGVVARSPVRRPHSDRNDMKQCSECGRPVEGNRGTHLLNVPETADSEYPELPRQVHVFGYVCEAHTTTVVLPLPTNENATNLPDGWTGVRLRFADELARYVPLLKRDLDSENGGMDL